MSKNSAISEIFFYKNPQGAKNQFLWIFVLFCEKAVDMRLLFSLLQVIASFLRLYHNMRQMVHICFVYTRNSRAKNQRNSIVFDKIRLQGYNKPWSLFEN